MSSSSIRPRCSSCAPIVGEKTSTFFPWAASRAIRTAVVEHGLHLFGEDAVVEEPGADGAARLRRSVRL
jgi:hypothetical protein